MSASINHSDNILEKIVTTTRQHEAKKWHDWEIAGARIPPLNRKPISILPTLAQTFTLISECKHASPSKGIIRSPYHPSRIAKAYADGGAHAISVVTEPHFFKGSLDHLRAVKKVVAVPVLRKDFIVHPYQIYEAYIAGADLFLLIKRILSQKLLAELLAYGLKLGLTPLIEIFNLNEGIATLTSIKNMNISSKVIIGINNRNLETFEVTMNETFATLTGLRDHITKHFPSQMAIPIISESGIKTYHDIQQLKDYHFAGALIGSSLLGQSDCKAAVTNLLHPPA
ncbi:indole-3-glycerol phosphate synthase [Spirochaetota bacterium]|nr:indole-3-glycerol phosphate synthase [Spirochaetota bacterium]